MAMGEEQPKPIDPLRHEFVASLDKYLQEAGMLLDAVELALDQGMITGNIADLLRQRVLAVRRARSGEED